MGSLFPTIVHVCWEGFVVRRSADLRGFDDRSFVSQTRLPPELAANLKSIMADYDSDLSLLRNGESDSEEAEQEAAGPLACPLVFPSGPLLEAITNALQARTNHRERVQT